MADLELAEELGWTLNELRGHDRQTVADIATIRTFRRDIGAAMATIKAQEG